MVITPDELMRPPTELEVADLLLAACKPDHQLSAEGVKVLRRLIFDWNRLKEQKNGTVQ